MAEFVRRKRFFKYRDEQCKKFLSKDFKQRCAYCKIREGDLSGPESFEKDHFYPLARGGKDEYSNLYYSCRSCNGKTGKSDYWTSTLLDPCNDDIWGVHIQINDKFICKKLTEQGDEYIKAFKLNRRRYVETRKLISEHQKDLYKKMEEYKLLCQKLLQDENLVDIGQVLKQDIQECEKILKYGANYRMSESAFDEDIDRLVCDELAKAGKVAYVDRDYDLSYELEICDNKYLCYIEKDNLRFDTDGKAKKYIATEKIHMWKLVNEKEKVLISIYNMNDGSVYYITLDEILEKANINNENKCAYCIKAENRIDKQTVL